MPLASIAFARRLERLTVDRNGGSANPNLPKMATAQWQSEYRQMMRSKSFARHAVNEPARIKSLGSANWPSDLIQLDRI